MYLKTDHEQRDPIIKSALINVVCAITCVQEALGSLADRVHSDCGVEFSVIYTNTFANSGT